MILKYRGKKHYIARAVFPEGSEVAKWWGPVNLLPVPHVLIMTDGEGDVIGWLRYHVSRPRSARAQLWAAGTWVEPEYRGRGIAEALWARVMKRYQPRKVSVHTISSEGRAFIGKLVKWFPSVHFEVSA